MHTSSTQPSPRAERAAVRSVAARVDAARLALARALPGVGDPNEPVERALGALLPLAFAGRPRAERVRLLRRLGYRRPGATLDALEPLLELHPSPALALRLVRAHEITRQRRLVREDGVSLARSAGRRRDGVYYTPPDVVRHLVTETLGASLAPLERAAERARGRARLLELLARVRALAVLDPACGAGLFLHEALRRLRQSYRLLARRLGDDAPAELAAPGRLALHENLYGVDLDRRALELAELLLEAELEDEPADAAPPRRAALVPGDHLGLDHRAAFPAVFQRPDPGFDVIVGNPPYARPSAAQRRRARAAGFRTHGDGDLYATFVEGLARLGRTQGRGGLIVPLSLTFSRHFRALREQVLLDGARRWRIACFDRIPSGLFEPEVRTRTAIVTCAPASAPRVETGPLLRFTAQQRPGVLDELRFADATGLHHPQLGFPKLGSALQADWLRRLLDAGRRLDAAADPQGTHRLHYKHNCYAFAIVAAELPPALGADGAPVSQTKYSSLGFASRAGRDQALALTAGAWLLWWWLTWGDGFDMTGRLLGALPCDPRDFSPAARRELARLGARIQRRVRGHVAFKKNSGKRIGTFDLRVCRDLTDAADALVAAELGAEELLADVRRQLARTHGTAWAEPSQA